MSTMRKHTISTKLASSLGALTLAVSAQGIVHATQITLSEAFDYNAFIFEDYTGYYSDVEGSLAVGGNLVVNDFDVGLQLSPDLTTSSLFVGGDIAYTNGKIRNGQTTVSGNIVANSVEFEGAVNAADNATITESTVLSGDVNVGGAFTSTNAQINDGDIHAGSVQLTNTSVENGDIRSVDSVALISSEVTDGSISAGGTVVLDMHSTVSDGIIADAVTPASIDNIDFDAIESEIKAQSLAFADMTVNGSTTFYCQGDTSCADSTNVDGIVFSGDDSINIYDIDADWLSVANKSITYDFSTTSYNIINVTGDAVDLFNTGFFNTAFAGQYQDNDQNANYRHDGTYTNNILFNFVDATSVTIQSIGVKGSILAPYADIAFYNGHVDGNLIASSVFTPEVYLTNDDGVEYLAPTGQVNNYSFGVTQVSAPGSILLMLPAFAVVFIRNKLKRKT
ncbi:choice-of-anchor A family protein [Alteromonas naphthalenivorans]|uniref:Rhs family protein n=1 Tax=Alteromonas naphthalenivorans TaxID=715451 RepID=F5Z9B0_ALTNA|nr:choice-of-anchor A family protein [Alteromonas naphthalenivorans]AEF01678.1 Rhs family protein [Alteromonas naphthalenivorans]